MANMANAVGRDSREFPMFQYHRRIDANVIVWPLKRIHDLGLSSFFQPPTPSESSLSQKVPVVFWRGSLVGMSTFRGKIWNIQNVIWSFVQGEISKDVLLEHLGTIARYKFVTRFHGVDGFDVGFSHAGRFKYYNEVPEIAHYNKHSVAPGEQTRYKYLPCLRGNDVGSSFRWQLATRSVILKESYPWEVFFDCHFKPWEHFVPIAEDFSDVHEKVAWCEANQDACEAMNEKRAKIVPLLRDQDIRHEALRRVLSRYGAFYERWAAG